MVKIKNIFGDEYKGRQGNAVYQKFYGRQIRRLWDGRKENTAPQQEEQKKRFRVGLAFWESLSREEREALKEYLRGIGSDLTAQQWAVKVALSRPRVVVQSEEVLANLLMWGEDWDAIGWPYRQKITLTNDLSTDLVGYQKLLELDASKVGDHFRWDLLGADLRFYDDQGNKLSYWVEEWDKENKTAKVWVRVSRIPAQGQATIKMYYGNAQAESESNPNSVFDFFDDFNDLSNWVINTGSPSTNDGILKLPAETIMRSTVSVDMNNKIVEGLVKLDSNYRFGFSFSERFILYDVPNSRYGEWQLHAGDGSKLTYFNGIDPSPNVWQLWRVVYSSSQISIYLDDTHVGDFSDTYRTTSGLYLRHWTSGTALVDWIRVRKYAEQEPAAAFGSEEVGQQVQKTTTTVTVKAIEHPALDEVRVYDKDGSEVWRAEGLTNIQNGEIVTRVRLPDEVVKEGVRALVRSAAGTVDIVHL